MSCLPRPSLLPALLLLAAAACGPVVDSTYRGEPVVTLVGQMSLAPGASVDGPVRLALAWYPGPLTDEPSPPSQPRAIVTEDIVYEGSFPVNYRFGLYAPPPPDALAPLGGSFPGRGAVGLLLAYQDGNSNTALDTIPATGSPIDRVLGASLEWTVSPAFAVLYLEEAPTPSGGLQRGFNLVKLTDAATSEAVPLSTRVPLLLSGGPFLDALVCEAGFGGEAVSQPCGLDLDGETPGDPAALRVEGTVRIQAGTAEADLLVLHDEVQVEDARVTLAGHPLAYTPERGAYHLAAADPSVFTERGSLEVRVVSRGQELRRTLSIPGAFELTAPAAGTRVARGVPLEVRWTASAGARAYDVTLRADGEAFPLASSSTTEETCTFEPIPHTGPATLVAEAVSQAPDAERLGWLQVSLVRSRPLVFDP